MSRGIVKCVVPISGGKDSQTCLELAIKEFGRDSVLGLFCDTGYEHTYTYEHVERMEEMYGVTIIRIQGGHVYESIERKGYFPSGAARFCTYELKVKPSKFFYRDLAEMQGEGFQVWLGMRRAESHGRAKLYQGRVDTELYEPHLLMAGQFPKYITNAGIMFRLPIVDWSDEDVYNFLDGRENELYRNGFTRVGCFPCLAGSDRQKERSFQFDELGRSRRIEVAQIEDKFGIDVFTSKGGKERAKVDRDNGFPINPELAKEPEQKESLCMLCQI